MTVACDDENEIDVRSQASLSTNGDRENPRQCRRRSWDDRSSIGWKPSVREGEPDNYTAGRWDGDQTFELNPRWLLAALAIVVAEVGGMYLIAYALVAS
jgi:hypothetical protein